MIKKTKPKNCLDISNEWDIISEDRQLLIEQGKDISLTLVTSPCILKHIIKEPPLRVLDAGCGSGYLTFKISELVNLCVGIDESSKSISIAKKRYRGNINFINCRIGSFFSESRFDACVSNMVLMTDPDWINSLRNIYNLLVPHGLLLITITHPCFWARYWNYQNETWFDYKEELFIEHDFSVSLTNSIGFTTHIHRPLSRYLEVLIATGFIIEAVEEPYPIAPTPKGYTYDYPRFLFIKCRKQ